MNGGNHDREALRRFLDRQYRQVWAVHRVTGERAFLDDGDATDAMRAFTRKHLKCPVPGCETDISAKGRSKRDHFFHLAPGATHGEGESEWHLQAKAMLTEWINKQTGQHGAVAVEEEAVEIPGSGGVRRADVMATWPSGAKVALEVEYKAYKPEDWAQKQADYDSAGIVCTWLFGHLHRYLRQRKPKDLPNDTVWDRLRWVELTKAMAAVGRPVLFVNPVERAIVTAVHEGSDLEKAMKAPYWWHSSDRIGRHLANPSRFEEPVLVLDPLDDCILDPEKGLVTPAMLRIEAEREKIEALAADAKAAHEAEMERRRSEEKEAAERRLPSEDAKAFAERKRAEDTERWLRHPLRARIVAGQADGKIPAFLACELPDDRGVFANHEHWHCQLFTDLVLGHPSDPMLGKTVTVADVYRMISRAGFKMHTRADRRGKAVLGFLYHLMEHGYVDFEEDWGYIRGDIKVVANLEHPPRGEVGEPSTAATTIGQAEMRRRQAQEAEREAEELRISQERARIAQEAREHEAEHARRRERVAQTRAARAARWEASEIRGLVEAVHGGEIPPPIRAPGLPGNDAIDALPEEWHAHIYMTHVYAQPPGTQFTLTEARLTLEGHGLEFVAGRDGVNEAVHRYLFNLGQRGFLERPEPDLGQDPAVLYTVTGKSLPRGEHSAAVNSYGCG